MTREELKAHCERQVEACEMWAHTRGEKPSGKVYEEHKLILELLEQESILDKIRKRVDLEKLGYPPSAGYYKAIMKILDIIDKYKVESEE